MSSTISGFCRKRAGNKGRILVDYFYARVSTDKQNEARQLDEAVRMKIPASRIYVDKQSGKDFERVQWVVLNNKLRFGDTLYIHSIDRLGRNYKEIIQVWQNLTKDRGIDVVVLDMPLLDTRREKNLLGTFIADVVLQVLSFVAENERANIRQRQREGIDAAKARGVKFGRPKRKLPECFHAALYSLLRGELTQTDAAFLCDMPLSTFRNRAKPFKDAILAKIAKEQKPGREKHAATL